MSEMIKLRPEEVAEWEKAYDLCCPTDRQEAKLACQRADNRITYLRAAREYRDAALRARLPAPQASETVAGDLEAVHKAFHDVAIAERNAAWAECERLRTLLAARAPAAAQREVEWPVYRADTAEDACEEMHDTTEAGALRTTGYLEGDRAGWDRAVAACRAAVEKAGEGKAP